MNNPFHTVLTEHDLQQYPTELAEITALVGEAALPLAAAWFRQMGGGEAISRYLTYLQVAESALDKSFSLVYEMAQPDQQQVMAAASVFAPNVPFTVDALEAVYQKKLPADLPTYISTIGDFYQTAFAPALKNVSSYRQRHLKYYQEQSEKWLTLTQDDLLAAEVAQFGQALHYAEAEPLVGLVLSAGQFLQTRDEFHSVLAAWLEYVLQVADAKGAEWGQAGQMRALGDIAVKIRQQHAARTFYYRAMLLYDNSMAGQAHTFKGLGDLNMQANNLESAHSFYHKALVLYEIHGFKLGQANTMRQLAPLSDPKKARDYYEKALAIYEELELQMGEAQTRKEMADLAAKEGDIPTAQANYEAALRIFNSIGFWVEEAHILKAIGDMYLRLTQEETARTHYDRALKLYEKAGNRHGQADVLRVLGNLALKQQRYNAAIALFRHARELYESVESHAESAAVSQVLAFLRLEQGNAAEAVRSMHTALLALDRIGAPRHEAENRLRDIAMHIGDAFPGLWKDLTNDAPLSRRLQDILNPTLRSALQSSEAMQIAIHQENILRQVARLEPEVRANWLVRALEVLDENTAENHLTRAVIYKELAAVPNQELGERLAQALTAYESALHCQDAHSVEFANTQLKRIALLRDMAGLPGENRMARLYEALEGFDSALPCFKHDPAAYAMTQFQRANLLRELAGLRLERASRAEWMYKALAAYDEVIMLLPNDAIEHAMAHTNRASLLQEIALLPNEDKAKRLKEALSSAAQAIFALEKSPDDRTTRSLRLSTQKLTTNIRDTVVSEDGSALFDTLWDEIASVPKPEWLR